MAELPPLIQAMLDPAFYPHHPKKVELIQTHISYIFLTEEVVFKVKKPVNFGFLDFTTLENRKHFCQEEIKARFPHLSTVHLVVNTASDSEDEWFVIEKITR